jgi:Flp pilus assembly protein protease CpaA
LISETALGWLRLALFLCFAAPATAVDLRSARIPDAASLGGLACLALLDALLEPSSLAGDCLAAAFAFGLLYALRRATGGLGFGDLKYGAFVAFYAGLPGCFAALAAAALVALLFLAAVSAFRRQRAALAVPFAPFLTAGALAASAFALSGALGGGA